MRRVIIGATLLIVVLIGGYWAVSTSSSQTPSAAATSKTKKPTKMISAEGLVVPSQRTTLAFKTGGRVVEIPVQEGDVVKAGTVLARLDDTLLKTQIAQAQAALNVAQKQFAQLRAGGSMAEREAARDALAAARAQFAKVKAGPTADELALLQANVDGAEAALAQAQFRYDRIGGTSNPFGGAAPESLALQQAYIALSAAQAAYRNAVSHPTDSELYAAQAMITQAESVVAHLDPRPEALALAQAQVDQAQVALDLATVAAQDAVLVAPFAGTVASLTIDLGQVVAPGMPAITFGNLAKLQIETTDLAEADIARVGEGQPVQVTLDALPEQVFDGRITHIAPLANDHRGDQVFKVTVALSNWTGLRWGMTANVEIDTGK